MEKFFTKDGRIFIVRQPTENNAASIIEYLKVLISSTDQIVSALQDHAIRAEEAKKYINNLDRSPNSLVLIAEIDHQVIGYLEFRSNLKKKMSHTGSFIVNTHPDFQHIGVGKMLLQILLNWAKLNSVIEKVSLEVLHTNESAIAFFKSMGFVEEGRCKGAIKQLSGDYVDILQMCIWTN